MFSPPSTGRGYALSQPTSSSTASYLHHLRHFIPLNTRFHLCSLDTLSSTNLVARTSTTNSTALSSASSSIDFAPSPPPTPPTSISTPPDPLLQRSAPTLAPSPTSIPSELGKLGSFLLIYATSETGFIPTMIQHLQNILDVCPTPTPTRFLPLSTLPPPRAHFGFSWVAPLACRLFFEGKPLQKFSGEEPSPPVRDARGWDTPTLPVLFHPLTCLPPTPLTLPPSPHL